MIRQSTIKQAISTSGVGLHSGTQVNITLHPAAVNHGIVFRRIDLNPAVDIPAQAKLVQDTVLCTALVNNDGIKVATIEHLMSALLGLGIDNVLIEIDAPEVPIMDGSAAPFVYLLQQAGLRHQDAVRRCIEILEPVEVRDGDKWAKFVPYSGVRFDFRIEFDHPVFRHRNNYFRFDMSNTDYVEEVARARTFGFLRDIEYLHNHGLALGGSLDNAIVIDEYRIMNEQGLRYEDEFVRHKLLDAMGDVYLCGSTIIGWYQGFKSGHGLNNQLALKLLDSTASWRWKELSTDTEMYQSEVYRHEPPSALLGI